MCHSIRYFRRNGCASWQLCARPWALGVSFPDAPSQGMTRSFRNRIGSVRRAQIARLVPHEEDADVEGIP